MQKIFLASFLFLLVSPFFVLAGEYGTSDGTTVCYDGLVPCGKNVYVGGRWTNGQCVGGTLQNVPCGLCHFFVMTNGIVGFVMTRLVPIIAVLMLVVGGVLFFFAGARPSSLMQAKGIITSVIIGLLIIFSAWVIVNTVLTMSGIVNTPSILRWYEIGCPIRIR